MRRHLLTAAALSLLAGLGCVPDTIDRAAAEATGAIFLPAGEAWVAAGAATAFR